jgi:pimeloyl-ACP methyl ester carboxylesterase
MTVAGAEIVRGDLREAMSTLQVPVLLVWGENDPLVPAQYGEAMQREIPGSRLVVIPRAAHVAMWDASEAFNAAALEFIAEVEGRPARPVGRGLFSWGLAGWTEGIAHRQAGARRDVVLVHGLGMSSRYYEPFARALHEAGWDPVAPDLPGFGESANAPAAGPAEHAAVLAKWADAMSIRNAVWVGHSISCNAVAHLFRERPDLVRVPVYIGPLWTASPFPQLRYVHRLVADAFREPLRLFAYVIPAYWRAGLWRWWKTWRACVPDLSPIPDLRDAILIAGRRDPLPDPSVLSLHLVPGAHACHFSHPTETTALLPL